MLEIKNDKNIYLDGTPIKNKENIKEVLLACLDTEIIIDDKIELGFFVHLMYDINDFINAFFVDTYESVRSLIVMGKLVEPCKYIEIKKAIEENDGFIYINKTMEMVKSEEGEISIGKLPIVIKEELEDVDGVLLKGKVKIKHTLIDVLSAIFEDLTYSLRNEPLLQ
jgi:hypothetical protein